MNVIHLPLIITVLLCFLSSIVNLNASAPTRLLCEGRTNPLGIDDAQPRFSWWVQSDEANVVQSAYQIVVMDEAGQLTWNTEKVSSAQSTYIEYGGPKLKASTRYTWKVRTWVDDEEEPSEWSTPAWFEMGLLGQDAWKAKWIGHPPRMTTRSVPPVYLRKVFGIDDAVKRARLYISARGIYEVEFNGEKIGNNVFAPGWTDYASRNQYLTYDVTKHLQTGDNAMGILLADGWHNGFLMWRNAKNWYGQDTSVIAQLMIEDVNGKIHWVKTNDSWLAATGPIIESDFYNGEKYDARAEIDGWSTVEYEVEGWLQPRIEKEPTGKMVAKIVEPVRRQEVIKPISVKRDPNGVWVYDFGQNVVGWIRVKAQADRRSTLTMQFAEMLNADGSLYLENLRNAEATNRYSFKDEEPMEWEPRFTFHGFRYAGLSGIRYPFDLDSVEAVVLHNDISVTGSFECSNPLLNQLQSNILWGQKGNFLEVPTDCPQRDERLGWTGDAQVFVRTATFNMDIDAFFEKWMADMRDAQLENGIVPVIIPRLNNDGASPAWSDAAVICPWVIYERYGNERILADNFELMRRWVDYQIDTSDDYIWPGEKHGSWQGFGDWLAIDAPTPGEAPTPKIQIGTAYFAQVAKLLAKAAEILGKTEKAKYYSETSKKAKEAFVREFVNEDGRLKKETQTGYCLALGFDILPEKMRKTATDALVADIQSRGWHLSTGFVGTGLLMPVLSRMDRNDVAYRILLQESYPGWLYSIKQGATTMWERWNSYSHTDGFGDAGMNSFNHYAYGAVGEWMYSVIGGIDTLEPGYKKILIRPQPGGDITWAKTSLKSPYGMIATDWNLNGSTFELSVEIPPNTTAVIQLPDGQEFEKGSGNHSFAVEI